MTASRRAGKLIFCVIATAAGCIVPIDPCHSDADCGPDISECWLVVCNSDGLCTYDFPEGACDDGNGCTDDDHCVDGECIGANICAANQICVGGTCQTPR